MASLASVILQSINAGGSTYAPDYLQQHELKRTQPDPDTLGFIDLRGISITQDVTENSITRFETTELDQSNAIDWLQKAHDARSSAQAPLRIFWAEQVLDNDSLRGHDMGSSAFLPKSALVRCLNLQSVAIEKMGTISPWFMSLPPGLSDSTSMNMHGISASGLSVAWSYDTATKSTYAFIVARKSFRYQDRNLFFNYFDEMKDFCRLPSLLPYAIARLEVYRTSKTLAYHQRNAAEDSRHLATFFYSQNRLSAFADASARIQTMLHMQQYARFVLKMTKQDSFRVPSRNTIATANTTYYPGGQDARQNDEDDLLFQALVFRGAELEDLIAGIECLSQRTANHMAGVLGMISFHQQETAHKISQATLADGKTMKDIAEATKKDSSSMKILALMTMIFLPSTATSAILAIPDMFDFSNGFDNGSSSGPLVSSRFWIFFAVAVPLTLITMAFTWCWLKWEDRGRPLPKYWPSFGSRSKPPAEKDAKISKIV